MSIISRVPCKASFVDTWWRHQMETFSALLAICAGNLPVPGEFPTQRAVTRSFDVFFDLRPNKQLSKQSWGWWFETLPRPLWRHNNDGKVVWMTILVLTGDVEVKFQRLKVKLQRLQWTLGLSPWRSFRLCVPNCRELWYLDTKASKSYGFIRNWRVLVADKNFDWAYWIYMYLGV